MQSEPNSWYQMHRKHVSHRNAIVAKVQQQHEMQTRPAHDSGQATSSYRQAPSNDSNCLASKAAS